MSKLFVLLGLLLFQGAEANTIWLKGAGTVCKNSKSVSSSNPTGIVGLGGIDSTFHLTINNPSDGVLTPSSSRGIPSVCSTLPTTGTSSNNTPIVFSGTLPADVDALHAIRLGTGNKGECLDQGRALNGIGTASGSSLTTVSGGKSYTLTLSYVLSSDGCVYPSTPPQALTPDGQPTFVRSVTVTGGLKPFNGTYYVFNVANPMPEPGSLTLLLIGGLAGAALWRHSRDATG